MSLRGAFVLGLGACFLACGGPEEDLAAEVAQEVGPGLTHLHFAADWSRSASGPLHAGGRVRVTYDAARLPQCRGEVGGQPAYAITAFARVNDGGVHSAIIHGAAPDGGPATGEAVFDVPATGELQLWFQVTNRWGCSQFDSDFGRNFRYPIVARPATRLVFDRNWNETADGPVRAGGEVIIEYDLARLPTCRATYRSIPGWDLVGYYRFDGGPATHLVITRGSTDRYSVPTYLAVPATARTLELWFHNGDANGCSRYDSNFGANYRFTVTR